MDKLLDFYVIRKEDCIKIYSLEKHQKKYTEMFLCNSRPFCRPPWAHMCLLFLTKQWVIAISGTWSWKTFSNTSDSHLTFRYWGLFSDLWTFFHFNLYDSDSGDGLWCFPMLWDLVLCYWYKMELYTTSGKLTLLVWTEIDPLFRRCFS